MKRDSSDLKSGVDEVVPQTASSIGSTLEPYTSSDYLSRVPDRHAGDSSRKPRPVAEMLSRYGVRAHLVGEFGHGALEVLESPDFGLRIFQNASTSRASLSAPGLPNQGFLSAHQRHTA
jgi:hypothetical protein